MLLKSCLVSTFLLIAVSYCQAQTNGTVLAEHGQKCNATTNCNFQARLGCLGGTCGCMSTFYDKSTQKCTAVIGGLCNIAEPGNNRSADTPCPAHASCMPYRKANKIPNSNGNTGLEAAYARTYVCGCAPGYASSNHGLACKLALTYGASCAQSASDCDKNLGFVCGQNHTCACPESEFVSYDAKQGKCVNHLGAKCRTTNQCEPGKICGQMMSALSVFSMADNLKNPRKWQSLMYTGLRCVCPSGTIVSTEGQCVGNLGARCRARAQCNRDGFLQCIDSICQCEHGISEVFDTSNGGGCRVVIGGACNATAGPKCVGVATCTDGHCKLECKEGSNATSEGYCANSYGNACDVSNSNYCSSDEGLACIEKKCDCFDSALKWDAKRKGCVSQENERCGSVKILRKPWNLRADHYVVRCAEGYRCEDEEYGISEKKVCTKHSSA